MRPPSPWPSEAGPTDSPTQTRGVGRTPGASARPGHGSAGGQVGEKIEKEDECCSLPLRCRAGARVQLGGTLPATGLPAICHLALSAALRCHRAPVSCPRLHKTHADLTGPPVPPGGRAPDPTLVGPPPRARTRRRRLAARGRQRFRQAHPEDRATMIPANVSRRQPTVRWDEKRRGQLALAGQSRPAAGTAGAAARSRQR